MEAKHILEYYKEDFEDLIKNLIPQFKENQIMMRNLMDLVNIQGGVDKEDMVALEFVKGHFELLTSKMREYLSYLKFINDNANKNDIDAVKKYVDDIMKEIGLRD